MAFANLRPALASFDAAVAAFGMPLMTYEVEILRAPHQQRRDLPSGHGAVYVFALAGHVDCPAGPGRVLKVGRVSASSNNRFRYQHYSATAAPSTLARSLVKYQLLWPWLGVEHLDASTVHAWMHANLDRANVYLSPGDLDQLPSLEMYIRAHVGSVYEGSA
ncbi:hypothetical protein AB0F43_31820 [Kribbella sp. NPDC023972]|uniref:hypothetical protein n=1 Tax=Kribbella sp. NPDC023972 TaxID=3154795 RepID=UPI0033D5101B